MKLPLLPLLLLAVLGTAIAADYPLDAPAPDGRRPGGTIAETLASPPIANDENK
ncbi:MAG TPA: cytochrome C, partial [Pseudomonas sp.]|nr:cytochrome C [Pseudomonas sp.]